MSWRSSFARLGQWLREFAPSTSVGDLGRDGSDSGNAGDGIVVHADFVLPLEGEGDDDKGVDEYPTGLPDGLEAFTPLTQDLSDDTAEDISVAVEVKLLLALSPASETQQQTDNTHDVDETAVAALAREAYGLIARTIRDATGQKSVTLDDIISNGRQERDFWSSHWIIKKANSAKARDDDGQTRLGGKSPHQWIPVEMCSPKLQWTSPATGPAIGAVLRSLAGDEHTAAPRLAVAVNYTCDVHVHVGRVDGQAFGLTTLKRLATLLWLAEDVLRSVRDPCSPNFDNVYTWGAQVRRHSRLAAMIGGMARGSSGEDDGEEEYPARDVDYDYQAIDMIWQARSHVELGLMLSGPTRQYRRLGFNFSSLAGEDERARRGPRTVEFRVLEGTLRDDVVRAWTAVCCTLVETAVAGDQSDRFRRVVTYLFGSGGSRSGGGVTGTAEEQFREFIHCLGMESAVADVFEEHVFRNRHRDDC